MDSNSQIMECFRKYKDINQNGFHSKLKTIVFDRRSCCLKEKVGGFSKN
jgi:hypothetical protein